MDPALGASRCYAELASPARWRPRLPDRRWPRDDADLPPRDRPPAVRLLSAAARRAGPRGAARVLLALPRARAPARRRLRARHRDVALQPGLGRAARRRR